jgi:hypothetical protein
MMLKISAIFAITHRGQKLLINAIDLLNYKLMACFLNWRTERKPHPKKLVKRL